MSPSGNGARPSTTSEEVAAKLRERLSAEIGQERTEAILRDPNSVNEVIADEGQAAAVAGIILQAWKDLPAEEQAASPQRRSAFRRGLRLVLVSAIAAYGFSVLKGRLTREEESLDPM